MRKIVLLATVMMLAIVAKAVPAYPGLITVTQSDGTQISYYLHGDENFSYITSTDGYLLCRNENGIMEYGDFSNGKYVVPAGVAAHDELNRSLTEQMYVRGLAKAETLKPRLDAVARQQKMKAANANQPIYRYPRQGSPRAIIILVGFSDKPFTKSKKDFEDLANLKNYSANGGTGSIKDYFEEASYSQFSPQFDVYGPYQLSHTVEYYGKKDGAQHDQNPQQMIIDACIAADNDGVDFSLYDTDNNGSIDNVFVYYAGHNQAEGGGDNTIWPHRSRVYEPHTFDGKTLYDYACTSELKGSSGSVMCGIGTFCHEFSHVVGLPDFYDTGVEKKGMDAMGSWDLMTQGNYNNSGKTPPTYTAYERFYVGWLTPTPLTEDVSEDCEGSYELKSLISSNSAYLISKTKSNLNGGSPNPLEFFMLEYRKKEGRDTHTEIGEGLLVTHVVYDFAKWVTGNGPNNDKDNLGYEPILPKYTSVQGNNWDCFPGNSGVNFCQLTARGESDPFQREVINIEDRDTCCAFDYIRNISNLQVRVKDIEAFTDKPSVIEEFSVMGYDISETVALSFNKTNGFKMRKKGDEQFQTSLTLTPSANDSIDEIIEIQYTPNKVTYDAYEVNKFMAKGSSGKLNKIAEFRYRNRRPVYITTPVANEASDVHGSSFVANWSYVNDTVQGAMKGAKYYLDVYTVSNTKSTEVESFEKFPEMGEGWSANFTSVNTTYRKDGVQSAEFSSSNDTLWTREYLSDVTEISFWIQSVSSEGLLKIEAQNYETGAWIKATNSISVNLSTSGDKTIPVPAGYRKFRITYEPTKGQLAFDCFSATTASTTTFICKNQLMTDTFYVVKDLMANNEYKYVVRATDKDEKGRYENVSENSNEIVIVTKEGGNEPQQVEGATSIALNVALIEGANRYVVSVSEVISGYSLFIYGVDGRLVKKLPVTSSEVVIPELLDGIYILKYTAEKKNNKKDGMTKLYYHLKN